MKTIKISLAVFVILLIVTSCKQDKAKELAKLKKEQAEINAKIAQLEQELGNQKNENVRIQNVAVQELKFAEFRHYIEVQGRIDGEQNVDVQPEGMGGTVQSVLVKTGQYVSKGQVLARLKDNGQADQLKALESNYELAKENFDRQKRLWDQKIGSEMQYLQAKANKEALEGQIGALREQMKMNYIKSPINGTVEEINVKIGQLSSPQMPIPAFRVVNFNTIKVKADVAEAYSKHVGVGDSVTIIFPDLRREVTTKVSAVSRYINPINRTFTVEVNIDPTKDSYKANMLAILKITDYKVKNAISIPVKYIQSDLVGNFVYVASAVDNKFVAKKAMIKQGQSYNGIVEITEGLVEGDKMINSGYLDLEQDEVIRF